MSVKNNCAYLYVELTMHRSMIGRLPYTSDNAPMMGDDINCSRENKEPMNPRI